MDASEVRTGFVSAALEGARGTARVLGQLTHDEIVAALELESATLRRATVLRMLIRRAGVLASERVVTELSHKYIRG